MTSELDAAEMYAAAFAARLDDHTLYNGTMWVRAGRPLTPQAVLRGLDGSGPSLSGYFLTPQSEGHVAAVDFDSEDGLELARRCRGALARRGAPSYVEASRRGAHLWVVCDRRHSGAVLRRFLRMALQDAGLSSYCAETSRLTADGHCLLCGRAMSAPRQHDNPKIELRPAQDEIQPDGYGSPLRLPTMPNPKSGRRYPVLDEHDRPLPPRLDAMMLAIDYAPSWVVESLASSLRTDPRDMPRSYFPPRPIHPDDDESASEILRELWGMPEPMPGRANRCPAHGPDRHPSLSIAKDDRRVWCKAPGCVLDNDGRGRGTHELRKLAPGATGTA